MTPSPLESMNVTSRRSSTTVAPSACGSTSAARSSGEVARSTSPEAITTTPPSRASQRTLNSESNDTSARAYPLDPRGSLGRRLDRQLDHERGRLVRQRLDPHPAAVGLHKAARDREPQTGAAVARGLGARAVERLEDPLLLGLGDAGPAVHDADQDAPADVARAHGHGMPAGMAVGVLEQVREGALELGGVGAHRRQVAVEGELKLALRDVLDRRADHLLDRGPRGARL